MLSPEIQNDRSATAGDLRREGGGRSWMALSISACTCAVTLFWTGLTVREGMNLAFGRFWSC